MRSPWDHRAANAYGRGAVDPSPGGAGRSPRAFSLIELLVVISIVSLLMSILVPSLGAARSIARTTAGLSNLRQLGQALYAYAQNFAGMLPAGLVAPPTVPANQASDWSVSVGGFIGGGAATYEQLGSGQRHPILRDPNAQLDAGDLHYSCNPILMPNVSDGGPPTQTYPLASLRRASEVVMLLDGAQLPDPTPPGLGGRCTSTAWTIDGTNLLFGTQYYDPASGDLDWPIDPGLNLDGVANGGNIRWRQGSNKQQGATESVAGNFLFGDGHAATRTPEQVRRRNLRPDR